MRPVGDGARESGRDRAYRHLRETMLADPAVQGTFLDEVELAQVIGLSRTPVRGDWSRWWSTARSRWCPTAERTCRPGLPEPIR
jgi:hypothetical protein